MNEEIKETTVKETEKETTSTARPVSDAPKDTAPQPADNSGVTHPAKP